jgi:hypothetical protein
LFRFHHAPYIRICHWQVVVQRRRRRTTIGDELLVAFDVALLGNIQHVLLQLLFVVGYIATTPTKRSRTATTTTAKALAHQDHV